jgi:hypothetical protein
MLSQGRKPITCDTSDHETYVWRTCQIMNVHYTLTEVRVKIKAATSGHVERLIGKSLQFLPLNNYYHSQTIRQVV